MYEHIYKNLLDNINNYNKCVLVTYLQFKDTVSGTIENKLCLNQDTIENRTHLLDDIIYEKIETALLNGKIETVNLTEDKMILIEPFFPKPRLFVFGGGHIAKPLVEFASKVGFSITVIDDRPYFANFSRFPDAENVICNDFKKSFDLIDFKENDFVVIITRGHKHDKLVLSNVINNKLSYIGMIGSKRRVKGMMEELIEEGYSKDILDSIKSPIGLDIGGITPEEIAISIVAELISFKNKGNNSKKLSYPEFDKELFLKISEKPPVPRAILTILSSKGSVPRKAGAKMVTYINGQTLGSIGGGCSEADVLNTARNIMRNNGFLIQKVDMTGDIAESIGMVCGGTMDVLIEIF